MMRFLSAVTITKPAEYKEDRERKTHTQCAEMLNEAFKLDCFDSDDKGNGCFYMCFHSKRWQ